MDENSIEKALAEKKINQESIGVDFFGSAGAGKSSYLSAIHRVLGYNMRGMEISRDTHRNWKAAFIIGNSIRGINRSNATYASCDALKVYGRTPAGIILMNFYAPGGHRNSIPAEQATSASVYFLDLELMRRAEEVVQQNENFEFFPFKDNRGAFFGIADQLELVGEELFGYEPKELKSSLLMRIKQFYKEMKKTPRTTGCDPDKPHLRGLRYAACRAFHLELFKEDELGIVIESALDAQLRLEERVKTGMPLIGIRKYDSRKPKILTDTVNAQGSMNLLLAKYRKYLQLNGFPYKPENYASSMSPVHNSHNLNVEKFDFNGVSEWYLIDSEPRANMRKEIIAAAHSIATKAIEKKGIDASQFRLIRFTKKNLEDGLTIHYNDL